MDFEKSVNPELLEEVFNEVGKLQGITPTKQGNSTKCASVEDLINLEKEELSSNCKPLKRDNGVREFNFLEKVEGKESVVHEGLTDSSEDEDNKYFEESSYTECGRTLKNLLKKRNDPTHPPLKIARADFWTNSKAGEKKATTERRSPTGNAPVRDDPSTEGDPILGMNIVNPLVSSTALRKKLIGRVSVSTSTVKQFLDTSAPKDSNWVTGGAIVRKLLRTSQKGNQYCVWHVTDLRGDIKTVCLFLFGSAYKEHWKTSLGTVVGILNPTVIENKENSEATFRVDNAQKILVIGGSKDYGICKAKKKNGETCSAVVNKSTCEYCVYHVKKEYDKACRRTDLQHPKLGRNLGSMRAKILGKNHVFYGGRIFTGVVDKQSSKQVKKDEERIKSLSQPRQHRSEWQKQKSGTALKSLSLGSEETPQKTLKNVINPTLPKSDSQMIDLGFTVSKKERNAAKLNALKYVRQNGPFKKSIDKDRAKKTPEQISSIKRKLQIEEENESKKVKLEIDTPKNPLKEKHFKSGITDEFLKLMNSGTRNSDLVKEAEREESNKYFGKLEMRERLENKMASTFKVECKAVRCLKCNYKTFSASDICKREKHPLKVVNAIKRFWKCGNCSARTVCLELVPLYSCRLCGSSKWERSSMMPERKDANLIKEPLSLRGDEEKFLGSANRQANLNLLVPEETA